MACLMNYTIQLTDVTSGKVGCFIFDTTHWQATGEFKAVSPVFPDLDTFFDWSRENGHPAQGCYLERDAKSILRGKD